MCYDKNMSTKDQQNVKELHYEHRYLPAAIARLYGVSRVIISRILNERKEIFDSDEECLLCGVDEALTYYIDGNEENNNPQNKIRLCKMHIDRIIHLHVRRRKIILEA